MDRPGGPVVNPATHRHRSFDNANAWRLEALHTLRFTDKREEQDPGPGRGHPAGESARTSGMYIGARPT